MKWIVPIAAVSWLGLWLTPDQRGQRLFEREQFEAAADAFVDPLWRGTAWYRAGEFEKAAQEFARVNSPVAHFNAANCWLLLGKYDAAINAYDLALTKRTDWLEAMENRELAVARRDRLSNEGGEAGDQRIGADKIVFDKRKSSGGEQTVVAGEQAASDASVQALWLRRVQTDPADFLKAKFAYQQALSNETSEEAP